MDTSAVLIAFALTAIAGLSTGVGSAIAVLANTTNKKFLSLALGFSAGVMMYVSFVEIFFEAKKSLVASLGEGTGGWATVAAFFAGIIVIGLIDRFVPERENPHEMHLVEEICETGCRDPRLMRLGLLSAGAIAIHNFPEGIATFMAALADPALGTPIAIAIAIHNIPEGIAVAVPIFYATGSRRKAFGYSFLSGLSEPVGALLGFVLLRIYFSGAVMGASLAAVAGIMVFISLDELLPAAREYGQPHLAIYGLVAGMAVMAMSLLMLH
ncbi:MAG TPA: zinc transporter ZupT [Spirochaetota bacterium]|nr:zinc transporter ZupT [Spirochaetota bacterium]HNT09411.1 zinc transporter ZupT [Spirochaetota bacterium]HPI23927.1 zinc transporter ZupT [Spirochaetota bacterium]HPU86754.1 zinc transporter ZupT [Spirochaetota bacterium]